MSYDIWFEISTGKEMVEVTDCQCPTYNLAPMFRKALGRGGFMNIKGKTGSEIVPQLITAVTDMEKNPEIYKQLNPKNGWGSYENAVETLQWILKHAQQHPLATLVIYGCG